MPGVEIARVRQIHGDVGAPRVLIDVEDLLPGLAAVGGLEDAALLIRPPLVSHSADQGRVRILRMHHDALDTLRVVEAEVLPMLAGVGGAVHAVAVGDGVPRVALTASQPEDVVVRRGQRQRFLSSRPADPRNEARKSMPPLVVFHTPPSAPPT